MTGFVAGFILSILGLTLLLVWSWYREHKVGFDPSHSRTDVIVTTSAIVVVMIGASVTLTKVVIEIGKFLCQ